MASPSIATRTDKTFSQMLPWDWDIDTQVSGATLEHMAKDLNRTTHQYTSLEHGVSRDYLLDINPAAVERERGDGYNIIDARWIDVRNGLYVDITGLSETHADVQPGILSCKNYHRYRTTDLFPLRESMFEGVPAKIPYAYETILADEYKIEALVTVDFHGYVFFTCGQLSRFQLLILCAQASMGSDHQAMDQIQRGRRRRRRRRRRLRRRIRRRGGASNSPRTALLLATPHSKPPYTPSPAS